ncbi:hypothetical protein Syun_017455 [Stephania yunnanensis]|uniref:Uncharacterized protein n=1 Tax=Stephania yunnanensis TaxID=152371 RepID=A0AAP0J981_9MAGN
MPTMRIKEGVVCIWFGDNTSTPYNVYYGMAASAANYGGYGGNSSKKDFAEYVYDVPDGGKEKLVSKIQKGTNGTDSEFYNPRKKTEKEDLDLHSWIAFDPKRRKMIAGGVYYVYEIDGVAAHSLISVTCAKNKLYAHFVNAPAPEWKKDQEMLKHLHESFKTVGDSSLVQFLCTRFIGFEEVLKSLACGTVQLFVLNKSPNQDAWAFAVGFAAGLMLSISFLDLAHNAINSIGFLKGNLWFFGGVTFFAVVAKFIPEPTLAPSTDVKSKKRNDDEGGDAKYLTKRVGIILNNFPEGMVVFLGSMKGLRVGVNLALAIALHNIPEVLIALWTRLVFIYTL